MINPLNPPNLRAGALVLLALLPAAALAGPSSTASMPGAEVQLLAGAVAGGVLEAGIEIRLAPGWKTYWRYPGDSGVPPTLAWTGSQNVAGVEMAWPSPKRFSDGAGGFSIGYKGSVLFPLTVRLAEPGRPARLVVSFDFAVCEKLCMPAKADLALDIAPEGGADGARILAGRASVPEPRAFGAADSPSVQKVEIDTAATPPRLVVEVRAQNPKADLFAEGPDDRWALPLPQKTALPDGGARFLIPLDGVPSGVSPAGARLLLTLVDGPKAVATEVTIPAP
ncbi:hypothetical protein EZH22_03485 [Xanthobacter dioxanivorans]|uniref:Thiol:disulfide interchange protein DsbD N-terminal domain-containing protein n=1 Tax=Xanthobacter dioxanivorans TaxID=2528964 RepID=A0A974SJG9_9HYPH|nr:protein-disulfide reductase DsbD domain-containing protein [Xanthobacter dioxanivorans]QRG07477.1 hypothetical protein EZH22_03485 [Xanthobacter dioxanivorans]